LRIEDSDGRYGFGEVAPIPWFGTESLEDALVWCREQEGAVNAADLEWIPSSLPCVRAACRDALAMLKGAGESLPEREFDCACLLPMTDEGLGKLEARLEAGFGCFKLKIGVDDFSVEQAWLERFWSMSEGRQVSVRLDANASLDEVSLFRWLSFLEGRPVEYLEQALPVGLEDRVLEKAVDFSTVLALDESLNPAGALVQQVNWPGVLVVKPLLIPGLDLLSDAQRMMLVGSSVFETAFGLKASLRNLALFQKNQRAIGYGVGGWFEQDGWDLFSTGPVLKGSEVSVEALQELWIEKT